MIGKKDNDPDSTCLLYEQINDGELAPWTTDGGKAELKEHVLCCAQLNIIEIEQDIEGESHSIWLDASHGWRGGSYDDGVEFCQEMGGKKLCPLLACKCHANMNITCCMTVCPTILPFISF